MARPKYRGPESMPQRIRDFGVAVLVLAAMFTGLALIDERVPEYLRSLGADIANGRAVQPGTPLGNVFASMAANPALDNYFIVAMVAVGVALFLLMLRT